MGGRPATPSVVLVLADAGETRGVSVALVVGGLSGADSKGIELLTPRLGGTQAGGAAGEEEEGGVAPAGADAAAVALLGRVEGVAGAVPEDDSSREADRGRVGRDAGSESSSNTPISAAKPSASSLSPEASLSSLSSSSPSSSSSPPYSPSSSVAWWTAAQGSLSMVARTLAYEGLATRGCGGMAPSVSPVVFRRPFITCGRGTVREGRSSSVLDVSRRSESVGCVLGELCYSGFRMVNKPLVTLNMAGTTMMLEETREAEMLREESVHMKKN